MLSSPEISVEHEDDICETAENRDVSDMSVVDHSLENHPYALHDANQCKNFDCPWQDTLSDFPDCIDSTYCLQSSCADAYRDHIPCYKNSFYVLLLDLGLDFKSYQHLTCPGRCLTNQLLLNGSEIVTRTVPTVGLLLLVLHSAFHATPSLFLSWMHLYRDLQIKLSDYICEREKSPEISEPTPLHQSAMPQKPHTIFYRKAHLVADRTIAILNSEIFRWEKMNSVETFHFPTYLTVEEFYHSPCFSANFVPDYNEFNAPGLLERLLVLLDEQVSLLGQPQAPSCRLIRPRPKGMICNLYISTNDESRNGQCFSSCQQSFMCNQIHLDGAHRWEHRKEFITTLGVTFLESAMAIHEVRHRIQDAIFYAKYGNRISLETPSGFVIFFKTLYTKGRLLHALKRTRRTCPACGYAISCRYGESCHGIHMTENAYHQHGTFQQQNKYNFFEEAERSKVDEEICNESECFLVYCAAIVVERASLKQEQVGSHTEVSNASLN